MAQGNKPINNNQGKAGDLPLDVIEQFIKTQQLTVQNEAEEIKIRNKEVDYSAQYALKSLEIQADIIKSRPTETRKTITRIAYLFSGVTVMFMCFIGYCLYIGERDFILKVIQISGYFGTMALGYYFGKKQSNNEKGENTLSSGVQDAEVIP